MIQSGEKRHDATDHARTKRPGRKPTWRILRFAGWTAITLIVLTILSVTALVAILNPERLTPIVERYASQYLDADVVAKRVELTFWHTFPRLTLDIDSLEITSRSLKNLPADRRPTLPYDADSLLSVDRISAGVNIAMLATGRIELYDVVIDGPRLNIVIADPANTNYNIVPPAEPDTVTTMESDTGALSIPDIAINRFRILNASPVTFVSVPDSLSVTVNINTIDLQGDQAPRYQLTVDGNVSMPQLEQFHLTPLTIGLDGDIKWNHSEPTALQIDRLHLSADSITATVSGKFDFTDSITVNSLETVINSGHITSLIAHIPDDVPIKRKLTELDTDMTVTLSARLTEPYTVTDSLHIPSAHLSVKIPDCRLRYKNARFKRLEVRLSADVNGRNPDSSTVTLERFIINGRAIDTDLSGSITSLLSDPAVDARFKGDLTIDRLPKDFLDRLPAEISGRIKGNAGVKMRMSQLHRERFHNLRMSGSLHLSDMNLAMRDSSLSAYTGSTTLRFGTSNHFVRDNQRIDSMLTVSIATDTAAIRADGITLRLRGLKAGVGTSNRSSTADTTVINPLGGVIMIDNVAMHSAPDSLAIRLRGAECRTSLKRFKGDSHLPELNLDVTAQRIFMRQPQLRAMLREPSFNVTAYIRPKRHLPDSVRNRRKTGNHRLDPSLIASNPESSTRLEVDSGLKSLLKRWNVQGDLKAADARVFMPAFPLRQQISDLDLTFSTDSVKLSRLQYRIGASEMTVSGLISNLRRSLTSRRGNVKLKVALDMHARYIDVNELARATFSAPADVAHTDNISDNEDETFTEHVTAIPDSSPIRPVIIPRNLEARVHVCADSMLYSDMRLHSFHGEILADNGAVNLADLSALTDIGDISLTALYSAPDTTDMQFGMGMEINNFHVDKMLDLIPAVDSLLPVMRDFSGIINADLAATSRIRPSMDFDIPSLRAAIKLEGDSLVLLDADTFKFLSKWLMFKNKKRNMIDHMSVEIVVDESEVELYPFMFDIDRYRLGVMGRNDMDMNLDYHVSVLKSPLPFKFGINIKGNVDDMKIRLGGAKFKENIAYEKVSIADTTRINLLNQIENTFRRGAGAPPRLSLRRPQQSGLIDQSADTISAADSVLMIERGFITPDSLKTAVPAANKRKQKNRK